MSTTYYISKMLPGTAFDAAITKLTETLGREGFGILTDIDVTATLKRKLDLEFRPYRILGACIPHFAHQALSAEDKIGTLLPCNVIVQEHAHGVEVAAIDPVASMSAVDNPALTHMAGCVREKLRRVVNGL